MDLNKCTHAYAVPGKTSLIDFINPENERTTVYGSTLEEIRERYPDAQRVSIADWLAERAAEQDTPIEWIETSDKQYVEMLNVLPPAFWKGGLFLVGEPMDHHALTGEPRFDAYRQIGSRYLTASRPMTRREAAAILAG